LASRPVSQCALKVKPENSEIWNERGIALANLSRHEETLASFDRALVLAPDYAIVWYNRGIALGERGRYQEALASFDLVLTLTPDWVDAWYNHGITNLLLFTQYAKQDKFDSGRHYWKKALESGQRSADEVVETLPTVAPVAAVS
jgi:tetratricopeptide (TPR) repeat protein